MKSTKKIILFLIIFFILSINSIYSFSSFLTNNTYSLIIKQSLFYFLGILSIILISKINIKNILNYSFYVYVFNILLLFLVLFFGTEINGSKAWFKVPFFGSFQPSEFMKIGLILYLSKVVSNTKLKNYKDEFLLLFKVFIITIIPSFITFLEPDTGAVLIYFLIAFSILFISKLRLRYFIFLFLSITVLSSAFLYLYIFKENLFIDIFGSSMFYRLDRIFDWKKSSGMQLTNSLIAIGSSGTLGNGVNNISIYYPEGHTDFIFTSLASIYGLLGMIILICTLILFDFSILNINHKNKTYKYIVTGFIGAIIYQQIQNISMTIGILPITGITLPFISYGGSSLLSYMILLGIIISIEKEKN